MAVGLALPATAPAQAAGGEIRLAAAKADKPAKKPSPAKKSAKPSVRKDKPPAPPPRKPEARAPGFAQAEAGNWAAVKKAISAAPKAPLSKVLAWMYLRAPKSGASFAEIHAFLTANPAWPDRAGLRRRAEEAIWTTGSDADRAAWFAAGKALTREGAVWMADRAEAQGRTEEAARLYRRIWSAEAFTADQEKAFLAAHGGWLRDEDHLARLDRLIWERRFAEAHRQLRRVSGAPRAMAEARIAMATMSSGAANELRRIPNELRNDPGVVYENARWLRRKNKDEEAAAVLLSHDGARPYPDLWWAEQATLARDALADGRISQAYGLAAKHALTTASGVADAEWLAGWIAFQFLKDNDAAERHFQRLYDVVGTPVSRARGAYWLARAFAARGNAERSAQWFAQSAAEPSTFYGQLAARRAGKSPVPLPERAPGKEALAWAHRHEFSAILRHLDQTGEDRVFAAFARAFYYAAHNDDERLAAVNEVSALSLHQGVRLSRLLRQHNVQETKLSYPIPDWIDLPKSPAPFLVLGVIRQESNFDTRAISSAGARGLMQLMPRTAEHEAKMMQQPYAPATLLRRPSTNVAIGSHYLDRLLARYDGHPALALAAYNAGERRVDQWLRNIGDPRSGEIDTLTWMESIPFKETRNYVQRVLENAEIYHRRLGGDSIRLVELSTP
ncbi:lytic transglycosylase domain-containing protein [Oleispirillum naphthae]|uniref:lytic transglycosylase domain-containing protein n=1 Tax=Oleispirillum naphthae TaxID=2838853 RepID=UPI003082609F